MSDSKIKTVRIAGISFELCGSLSILDEFVCYSEEKSNGQIFCCYEMLYNGSEKPAVSHNGISVFGREDGSWLYALTENPNYAQVTLSADGRIISVYSENSDSSEAVFAQRNLLRMALESVMVRNSRLSLHSSCVAVNGEGVAFTGFSGMGKSTRADAWVKENGAAFISGDRPALGFSADGVKVYGVPWDGKEQVFRSVEYPLRAILEVRRSETDYLRKLTPSQAQRVLMKQAFIPMWDTNAAATAIMNIRKLSKSVPVYRLFCGPERENAKRIYEILFNRPNEILEVAEEMKIKEGFVLRNVADEYIVMPTGGNIAKFDGAVVLNDVSAFIFEKLLNPASKEDIVTALIDEYDVDAQTAAKDVDALVCEFEKMGIIE